MIVQPGSGMCDIASCVHVCVCERIQRGAITSKKLKVCYCVNFDYG